jgi:hypothetical protein
MKPPTPTTPSSEKTVFTGYKSFLILGSVVVFALAVWAMVCISGPDRPKTIAVDGDNRGATVGTPKVEPGKQEQKDESLDQIVDDYVMRRRKINISEVVHAKELAAYGATPAEIKHIESYPLDQAEPAETTFAKKLAPYLNSGIKWNRSLAK